MAARDPEILTITGLTRRFGEHTVLADISVSLRRGQICAVTGPNGAGKTTLLRCVVGALKPDAGTITLLGRPVDEADPHTRAAVASILDDIEFFPDLSVAEHLELMAYAHGTAGSGSSGREAGPARSGREAGPARSGREAGPRDAATQIMAALDLDPVRDQVPPTLSSGQRRRLALASCFVRPRRLLVLDEPEQRLDAAGRAWLADQLQADKSAGIAVIMASHDSDLVDAIADLRLPIEPA